MRFAGNFHPEWGYLAPAPIFIAHGPHCGSRHGDRRHGRCRRSVVAGRALGARCDGRCRQDFGRGAFAGAASGSCRARSGAGCRRGAGARRSARRHRCAGRSGGACQRTSQRSTANQCSSNLPANAPVTRQPSAPPVTASAQPIALPPAPSNSRAVSTSAAPASVAALSESTAGHRGFAFAGDR